MAERERINDPIAAVALLDEPTRRRLYDFVVAGRDAIGRDDAAEGIGISRELAAFHLDRLATAGLLKAEFRRRTGRTGPGAGRPAKLYRPADRDVEVSLPPRRYEAAAEVLATAVDRLNDGRAPEVVADVARERGAAVGGDARPSAGSRPSRRRVRAVLLDVLRSNGYEPDEGASPGAVCLRNCPYDALVSEHRDLTCGMNLAWAEGLVDALGNSGLRPELKPKPGFCCVEFRPAGSEPA